MLRRSGIDTVFSLNGGHISLIYDACIDEGMRIIDVRHEEAAGHMAHAFARTTGKVGVAAVSAGPGVTNIVTAVANAFQGGCPMLVIGGKAPLRQFELGALQDIPQVEIMAPITKMSKTVFETARIPEYVAMALRVAASGRPGPVYLEIPTDVLRGTVKETPAMYPEQFCPETRPASDSAALKRIVALLESAERPLILAGGGVHWSGASSGLKDFAEQTGIPVILTSTAKGCLPSGHAQLVAGARSMALSQADVVLVVGARFNFILGYGRAPRFHAEARIIQIDIDPAEIGRNRPVEVGVLGDARIVLRQLTDASLRLNANAKSWLASLRRKDAEAKNKLELAAQSAAVPIHPWRLCGEIQSFLDDDAIVVADGGDIFSFSRVMIQTNYPGHWLDPGAFGCLGVGIPFAIAAKLANPGKQTLCITGDGAFGLTAMEFDTAVRHKVPIVVVISNNAAWAIERTSQRMDFGPGRIIGTELLPSRYDSDGASSAPGAHWWKLRNRSARRWKRLSRRDGPPA